MYRCTSVQLVYEYVLRRQNFSQLTETKALTLALFLIIAINTSYDTTRALQSEHAELGQGWLVYR